MTISVDESGWEKRRSLLQAKYEQIAWDLFAKHGFRDVTVEEIAEASGVSARTLFRYFPVKEDFLLGFTRRGLQNLVNLIAELEPSPDPVWSVWQLIRTHSLQDPQDVRLLTLWRRAAAEAPEIHARVRGERMQALTEAVTDYCAKSKGDGAAEDPEPRVAGRCRGGSRDGGDRALGPVRSGTSGDLRSGRGSCSQPDAEAERPAPLTLAERNAALAMGSIQA